ncbi:ABC transporter ATP-binding protein [Mycobacterium sp. 236(2023)]|uniref:ABC transporter ATP-binding protein n=1 Tax=Mycobacterium sp. 236(2023) TaxID=3038163 RepID=UPI00241587E2|nr:ABC transporter ATP-binding protein [Mycobacterium sp. 236(2023)]MDG4663688.1 ABC transporter ATP-binding protein [Mycobacterium sp. 236(2023)]
MNSTAAIRVDHVVKNYGVLTVLDDVSVEIGDGEFFTLLGPSGSGKSTLLRIIAGLLDADSGDVVIGGQSMTGRPAHTRELGVVFQSLALFPHLSVGDNVGFPLRMRRVGRKEIARRVSEALDLVQLPDLQHRAVSELSGGQSQRVALARALVYQPRILLLDEPLSALDRRLRESMQLELTRIHRELGVTIVNVTHDQREALMVSDRIAVMDAGRIVQCGRGTDLYASPATTFVAGFLGDPLLLEGSIATAGTLESSGVTVAVGSSVPLGRATAVMRPERLRLVDADARHCFDNGLPGEVLFSAFDGHGTFYQVRLDCGPTAAVHIPAGRNASSHAIGDAVIVAWNADDVPIVTQA